MVRRKSSRRNNVHYYLTTANKPKTINTSKNENNINNKDKQHYVVEKNSHEDLDLSLINVGDGDSVGWYICYENWMESVFPGYLFEDPLHLPHWYHPHGLR